MPNQVDDLGEVTADSIGRLSVQSELELVFAGVVGFATGVADVVPVSLDFEAPFDDEESDDDESEEDEDVDESVDDVVADDFDFPPRLSVL